MDNWYVVRQHDDSIQNLLHMIWEFHDFRIIDVTYSAEKDTINVLFEYDDRTLRILLQFTGNVQMYIAPIDFEADWISGAALHIINGQYQWINCEQEELEFIRPDEKITYFQGDSMRWAIVDKDGNRLPVSEEMLHQTWRILNYETMEYEEEVHDFTVIPYGY